MLAIPLIVRHITHEVVYYEAAAARMEAVNSPWKSGFVILSDNFSCMIILLV